MFNESIKRIAFAGSAQLDLYVRWPQTLNGNFLTLSGND